MNITIDPFSGFCAGVVHAVKVAERELGKEKPLYCLGELVHNEREVARLRELGLIAIDREEFRKIKDCTVMIRAHGEPPETYSIAKGNNILLIDATCSIVKRLQRDIHTGFREMESVNGQVVIYGKAGHAEVEGLQGQTGGKAIIIGNSTELEKIDPDRPVRLFSQTTMNPDEFNLLAEGINQRMGKHGDTPKPDFSWRNTICHQVANRSGQVRSFAGKHEMVIFVSGRNSSNGTFLLEICREVNANTYFVSQAEDLEKKWFSGVTDVGICGATSTPVWLMEEVLREIRKINGMEDVS
jgi:4-hydroxy-3-methylbut-2-en-1-yl diphosphate reductase